MKKCIALVVSVVSVLAVGCGGPLAPDFRAGCSQRLASCADQAQCQADLQAEFGVSGCAGSPDFCGCSFNKLVDASDWAQVELN